MDEEPGLHLHVELHVLGDKVCVDARHRLTTILGYKYSPTNKFYFFQILDLRSKKVPKTFALQKPLKTKKSSSTFNH